MADELALFGEDLFGDEVQQRVGRLAQRFIVPPFTVLDATQGYWRERKEAWRSVGFAPVVGSAKSYAIGSKREWEEGKAANVLTKPGREWDEKYDGGTSAWAGAGSSAFDPVLAEVVYRWWCPPGGRILDPFAGESVKGIVAAVLGYEYLGLELRPAQVEANRAALAKLNIGNAHWLAGDSARLVEAVGVEERFDLIFTSPPYYNLETYEGGDADGSGMGSYEDFMAWYRMVFAQAVLLLKPNGFLAVKVGEVRSPEGFYYNFVGDNIACFTAMGLRYYNEAILVTPRGSLPIRTSRQFNGRRKLGKTHQNVLVFYNGRDHTQITELFQEQEGAADEGSD